MKIAIVYDWMDRWGGAERFLLMLSEIFPDADWYTSYVDPSLDWHKQLKVRSTFMQNLPSFINKSRVRSIPFYPFAFESINFSSYDLVFSVSSFFAKSVITRPETKHIGYMLTTTRMLWGESADSYGNSITRSLAKPYLDHLKKWDYVASQRADTLLTLSTGVQKKIKEHYGRHADVVYPPFDFTYWETVKKHTKPNDAGSDQPYFLMVSRLEPYKRVDLAIDAFREKTGKLIVIGSGSLLENLKSKASNNITFAGDVSDNELAKLYTNAQALIMPQEEDFGYVALEAQFFGCPVIAFSKGGALETIKEEKTGIFFNEQTPESLHSAIEKFNQVSYTLQQSVAQIGETEAKKFSIEHFHTQIKKYL